MPYWRLSGVYFVYFAIVGALFPYWGLYLEEYGYNPRDIGILTAIPLVTRIVAPNLWGWLADSTNKPLLLIRLGAFGGAFGFMGVQFHQGFWFLALAILFYSFFWNAVLAQYEVVTLRYLGDYPFKYSRIRLWGSIGFIVAVIALGVIFDYVAFSWLTPVVLVLMWLLFACSCSLPALPPSNSEIETGQFFKRLRRPTFLLVFFILFLLQFSHGTYYTFYSIYLKSYDYSNFVIGLLWSLGVVAEIVLFFYMPKILHSVSLFVLLSSNSLITAVRWWLIGTFPESLPVLLFAQLLHAASFGAIHAFAIEYIRRNFTQSEQSHGHAFYSAIGFGVGGALGAYVSGEIWLFSAELAYSVACASALLAWLMTLVFIRKKL